jgi:hypothetical protein
MSQSAASSASAASSYSYEKKVKKEVKEAAKTYSSSEETRMHPEQYNGIYPSVNCLVNLT